MHDYADFGITVPPGRTSGQFASTCPRCSHDRKAHNQRDKCLSISLDEGTWNCKNCNKTGSLKRGWTDQPLATEIQAKPEPKKAIQKFIPEQPWNWVLPDAMIDPVPENPTAISGKHYVTWFFRDTQGRLTGAKRMLYDFSTGQMKRDKDHPPLFTHTRDNGYYSCLFLEHNITLHPKATIILVESEKTAAMLTRKFAAHLDEFVYVGTGGAKGLTDDKTNALKDRSIWICYDCDNGEKLADGTIKNPRGREGAQDAYEKLQKIADARVIDIDPAADDGKDLADIIKTIDIDYIRALSTKIPLKIQELWSQVLIDQEPPPEVPLVHIQNQPVFTHGNYSLIIGKKKSRKTLFLTWLIGEYLKKPGTKPEDILLFDTEQGKRRAYLMRERIKRYTNHHVPVFDLRGRSPEDRMSIIDQSLQYWPTQPKFVIFDGVRDLMSNINDPDESTKLIVWLERIIMRHNCHITNVLHLNKTDGNARGHIGTELLNKVEVTIELELDEQTNVTKVKCESSRDKGFEPFSFVHGQDGLPEIFDSAIVSAASDIKPKEKGDRLKSIFEDGPLTYSNLITEIKSEFGIGKSKAEIMLKEFRRLGWIAKPGNGRDPKALWRFMGTENGYHQEPESEQQEMNFQAPPEPQPEPVEDPDLPF